MAGAARTARVLTFVLSLIVIPAMVVVAVYAGSRWKQYVDDPESQLVFWATVVLWFFALACLATAARSGRASLYTASLLLFALTLVGEGLTYVVFTVT